MNDPPKTAEQIATEAIAQAADNADKSHVRNLAKDIALVHEIDRMRSTDPLRAARLNLANLDRVSAAREQMAKAGAQRSVAGDSLDELAASMSEPEMTAALKLAEEIDALRKTNPLRAAELNLKNVGIVAAARRFRSTNNPGGNAA